MIIWFRYIAERQRVFHRWFDRAPSPWTEDATISRGRMCNVHRYLDRESVWAIANLVEPLRHRPADLLFNIIMFRCYFNWHKSAEKIGLQSVASFNRVKFEAKLRKTSVELGKLSSAAYNVGSFQAFESAGANGIGVKPARAVSRQLLSPVASPVCAMQLRYKCYPSVFLPCVVCFTLVLLLWLACAAMVIGEFHLTGGNV